MENLNLMIGLGFICFFSAFFVLWLILSVIISYEKSGGYFHIIANYLVPVLYIIYMFIVLAPMFYLLILMVLNYILYALVIVLATFYYTLYLSVALLKVLYGVFEGLTGETILDPKIISDIFLEGENYSGVFFVKYIIIITLGLALRGALISDFLQSGGWLIVCVDMSRGMRPDLIIYLYDHINVMAPVNVSDAFGLQRNWFLSQKNHCNPKWYMVYVENLQHFHMSGVVEQMNKKHNLSSVYVPLDIVTEVNLLSKVKLPLPLPNLADGLIINDVNKIDNLSSEHCMTVQFKNRCDESLVYPELTLIKNVEDYKGKANLFNVSALSKTLHLDQMSDINKFYSSVIKKEGLIDLVMHVSDLSYMNGDLTKEGELHMDGIIDFQYKNVKNYKALADAWYAQCDNRLAISSLNDVKRQGIDVIIQEDMLYSEKMNSLVDMSFHNKEFAKKTMKSYIENLE